MNKKFQTSDRIRANLIQFECFFIDCCATNHSPQKSTFSAIWMACGCTEIGFLFGFCFCVLSHYQDFLNRDSGSDTGTPQQPHEQKGNALNRLFWQLSFLFSASNPICHFYFIRNPDRNARWSMHGLRCMYDSVLLSRNKGVKRSFVWRESRRKKNCNLFRYYISQAIVYIHVSDGTFHTFIQLSIFRCRAKLRWRPDHL